MDADLPISRRGLLSLTGAAAAALAAEPLSAQWSGEKEVVKLWPGTPPNALPGRSIALDVRSKVAGNRSIRGIADPVVVVRRPARPNGGGMIVIPGGGYGVEMIDGGGVRTADMLNRHGITAFILTYRLPMEGWRDQFVVPLQDAQRAMRLIRTGAANYGVKPDQLAVLGSSAGGHLAGSLATMFDDTVYAPVDAADQASARPDLAVLMYPVVTMTAALTHAGSRRALIGADADAALTRRFSLDGRVTAGTPPTFITAAGDDKVVPVENSILMYQSLLKAGRPAALHLFETGGHGFRADEPATRTVSAWPELMLAFARSHGFPTG